MNCDNRGVIFLIALQMTVKLPPIGMVLVLIQWYFTKLLLISLNTCSMSSLFVTKLNIFSLK